MYSTSEICLSLYVCSIPFKKSELEIFITSLTRFPLIISFFFILLILVSFALAIFCLFWINEREFVVNKENINKVDVILKRADLLTLEIAVVPLDDF